MKAFLFENNKWTEFELTQDVLDRFNIKIGNYVRIGTRAKIGDWAEIDDYVSIGECAEVGTRAKICAGAEIGDGAEIGYEVEIANRAKIGAGSKIVVSQKKGAKMKACLMKKYTVRINTQKFTVTANSSEEANKMAWRMWFRWSGERLRELEGRPGSDRGPCLTFKVNQEDIPYFYMKPSNV